MATQSAVRNKRATSDTQTVLRQVDQLQRMSLEQLKKRWADLLGTDPGPHSRDYLIRRLAYRLQELVYGGVTRDARQKLQTRDGAPPGDATSTARRKQASSLQPGTRLLRDWRGQRYEVIVQDRGFLYDGKKYRSLSAIARAITGSYWSGNRFFGLTATATKEGKTR
jgi:hypothetical protein